MFTILIFVLVLGLCVFVHETGHFVMARRNGVKAEEFGFGFPPRMFGFKKTKGKYRFFWGTKTPDSEDTIYSLNWIPVGGFVKIKGEEGQVKDKDSFISQSVWVRMKIVAAGVLMNFLLAVCLLTIGFWQGLPTVITDDSNMQDFKDLKIQMIQIEQDSPASQAGLEIGDAVVAVNGQKMSEISQIQDIIGQSSGHEVSLDLISKGEAKTVILTPIQKEGFDRAVIGVSLVKTGIKSYNILMALWMGFTTTGLLIGQILFAFFEIFKNLLFTRQVGMEVSGPVGIAVLTGQVAKMGWVYLLQFTALLSVNLGVINFFPFPALDGGKFLFLCIEKIRGKAVQQRLENAIHTAGFALLMLLVIVVTFQDVLKFSDKFLDIFKKVIGL